MIMFKQSVSIIDDDQDILKSTSLSLKDKGYEVFAASTGTGAVSIEELVAEDLEFM